MGNPSFLPFYPFFPFCPLANGHRDWAPNEIRPMREILCAYDDGKQVDYFVLCTVHCTWYAYSVQWLFLSRELSRQRVSAPVDDNTEQEQ